MPISRLVLRCPAELVVTGSSGRQDVLFAAAELERGISAPAAAAGLQHIEDVDYTISPATLAVALNGERCECRNLYPHLMLCNCFGNSKWHCCTSIVLVFEKALLLRA